MDIRFETPWLLLLFIPFVVYMLRLWKTNRRLKGFRKAAFTFLRALLLLVIIFALAGAESVRSFDAHSVVFVFDRSFSMPDTAPQLQWMEQADKSKRPDDKSGVVSIGSDALAERQLSTESLMRLAWGNRTNGQFTNLENGLKLAGGMLSGQSSPRIVLVSDGLENTGDALREARLLKDRGIPVDVLSVAKKKGKDAAIEAIRLPDKLYQAEAYSLEVQVTSTNAGPAVMRVFEDQSEIAVQSVSLEQGENRYVLKGLAKEPGLHRYRAEIYVEGDEQSANNAAYAFSRVSGPPRVLVVEGTAGSSQNITAALESALLLADVITPEQFPREMAGLTTYDSIVLNNSPATRFSGAAQQMMEQAVKDYGIGLVMLGGDNSYGIGGYFDTPVEKALPVYMDLRGKKQLPTLGLVLVIDKSGSMSGEKIALAQEAASRTVQFLRDQDTLGVLAFDSSPWWVISPQKLKDKKQAVADINSIRADGGTEIYTALEEAYRGLAKVDAERKHIILLTDGQSSTNQSYEALSAEMGKQNITVSTMAIGMDADRQLLETVAKLAKGRYYYVDDQSTIPAIFSREAVMMTRTYVVDQLFQPLRGVPTDWDSLWNGGVPQLGGYIAATPKETAEVVLRSPEPDPVLARWQYGSGRSVAFTSDVTGKWSSRWVSWPLFPRVLTEMIKWTFPQFGTSPFELTAQLDGGDALLHVKSSVDAFEGKIEAVVTGDNLKTKQISLLPEVPGEYSARLGGAEPGVYVTQLHVYGTNTSEESKPIGSVTTGFVIPYSPEYRLSAQTDNRKLLKIAQLTGGRVLTVDHPEAVFQGSRQAASEKRPLERVLLILAVMLWVLDIALRRVSVNWSHAAERLLSRMRRPVQTEAQHNSLTRLIRRTQSLAEQNQQSKGFAPSSSAPDHQSSTTQPVPDASFTQTLKMDPAAGEHTPRPEPAKTETGGGRTDAMDRLLSAKNRTKRR